MSQIPPSNVKPWYAKNSQRKPARVASQVKAKILRRLGFSVIAVLLLLAAGTNYDQKDRYLIGGGIQHAPTLAGLAGGCSGISDWNDLPKDEIGWVPQGPGAIWWRIFPPVSGNFNKVPWKRSGYIDPSLNVQPLPSQALASAYRGWIIVWTSPNPQQGSLIGLNEWVKNMKPGKNPVLIARWSLPQASTWPRGRNIIFVSWNHAQGCSIFDPEVAEEYRVMADATKAPGAGLSMDEPGPRAKVRTTDVLNHI